MSKQWRVEIENHDGTRSMLQVEEPTEADAAARAKRNGHRVIAVYPDTRGGNQGQKRMADLTPDEYRRVVASGVANGIVKYILFAIFFLFCIGFALRACGKV